MAAALLEPIGMTILDAAKAAVARAEASGGGETFEARWKRYCDEGETHWRPRYAADMGKIPRWVPKSFLQTSVQAITPASIRTAVIAGGASAESTIKARATRVAAVLAGRGSRRRMSRISIMTGDQIDLMFAACDGPDERRAVALLIYAGIRPSAEDGEITRLQWEDVGGEEIYIAADVAKTGTDRHIPITPRLRDLLEGQPADGPVIPAGWKVRWQRLRKAAGISKEQDITRHTFASHFLAAFGVDPTRQAMGHSAGSDTLFRHYRRAVTEADGKAYFGVKD
jgi:integrase